MVNHHVDGALLIDHTTLVIYTFCTDQGSSARHNAVRHLLPRSMHGTPTSFYVAAGLNP